MLKSWIKNPLRIFEGLLLLAVIGLLIWVTPKPKRVITNFDQCASAGYPIQDSYPAVCRTPDGRSFVQSVTAPPAPPSGAAPTTVSYDILVSNASVLTGARQTVVRNQADWQTVWNQVHAKINPMPNLIPVDFNKEMVVVLVLDQKPTAGYYVSVSSVTETADKISVNAKVTSPGKGCTVAQTITEPYTIIKFAKSNKPVAFALAPESKDCAAVN